MNKLLLVEDHKITTSGTYDLEYHNASTITLNGNITLTNYDTENYDLTINMLNETYYSKYEW